MKKIAFFAGSFDPIHVGHIHMALLLQEKLDIQTVFISPSYISPFKLDTPPFAKPQDRLEMVKLATADIASLEVVDFEVKNTTPSYTVDSLRFLKQSHKEAKIFFMLGADAWEGFALWKEAEEILKIAEPLVFPRRGFDKNPFDMPRIDVSSTEVRSRIQKDLYYAHLVPAKVKEYIVYHQLYKKK